MKYFYNDVYVVLYIQVRIDSPNLNHAWTIFNIIYPYPKIHHFRVIRNKLLTSRVLLKTIKPSSHWSVQSWLTNYRISRSTILLRERQILSIPYVSIKSKVAFSPCYVTNPSKDTFSMTARIYSVHQYTIYQTEHFRIWVYYLKKWSIVTFLYKI